MNELTLQDFDFFLPEALIAQHPAPQRAASRLLRVEAAGVSDLFFVDLPQLLRPGDLLVMNDTKVIKARFFGRKDTGGQVEVLLERILDARHALAQIRAGKAPKTGCRLDLAGAFSVRVTGRQECFFLLALEDEKEDFWSLADAHGRLPLPPYITHAPAAEDEARYQTIYARAPGAVAAPTAGLHFDAEVLEKIAAKGVRTAYLTLHVGAGTYQPVRVARIREHRMHKECFVLPEETAAAIRQTRAAGGRVVAVGTTALRALESAACGQGEVRAGCGETDIFITPGFDFQVADCLITNFHLPCSTLLMLVSAFAGVERIRAAYAHAIERGYRFFSYGDAMLLTRAKAG
ncbi:MAG: tRNA preQ1(34) S-adenosylmethionine ribosyltransferase-isomerase QueA [Zoogloeaceae bacterium]|nr:tRNA preQ1(34) S-adenosylmethionine ribosyltransferase-isomerase QueA [Zoogloeaceae bacterium]